ncbi:MAG: hypothetical protein JW864_10505 [Spirochaetes bacterium]|nr:hypothetical protein [Spirochaetota bacterium]
MFRHRQGRGRGFGGRGRASGKECICPKCKTVIPHKPGTPCYRVLCPNCATPMMGRFQSGKNPE